MTTSRPRRVLILGGGFGGVAVAQELERLLPKSGRPLDVTLISRDNYLLFVPMLAEAATGSIELPHILTPLRELLPSTRLRIEHVQSIDLQRQTVTTVLPSTHSEYVLEWDDLVIALGNVVSLVGLPGVAEHGLPIKTIGDALHVRNRTVEMLEGAENQTDPVERRRLLTFVVAGGGFSGVEVAAELNDFLREAERAYPTVTAADVRVIVLHSGDRILPELSPGLAAFAQRKLAERGVEIRLGQRLAAATAHEVVLQSGERIDAHTLIVAIGAGQNPAVQNLGLPVEHGRLQTDALLRVRGQEHVWALGDCAAVPDPHLGGEACPPTAQFALRQGRTLAYNLVAATRGRPLRAFRFGGLGQLVSLGHRSAVAELPFGLKVAGLPAWLMWRSFYLFRLPGLERKLRVSLDWSLDLLFRRDLVELNVERTERVALAHYEPGQVIIRQGDLADSFYVLVNGEVQVVREEPGGEQELARMQPGDIFGEMGLLRQERRNATVRAVGRVDVLMLGQQDFQMLAKTWKHLGKLVEDVAASRDGGPPGSGSEVRGPSPEGPSTGADDVATTAPPPG